MPEGLDISGLSEEEKNKLGEEKMADTEAAMSKSREETHEYHKTGESNITRRLEEQAQERREKIRMESRGEVPDDKHYELAAKILENEYGPDWQDKDLEPILISTDCYFGHPLYKYEFYNENSIHWPPAKNVTTKWELIVRDNKNSNDNGWARYKIKD